MAHISKQDILKLANMSMIGIYEQEEPISRLTERLNGVLDYASSLIELAKNQSEGQMPHNINRSRADQIIKTDPIAILALAPKCEENYFVVPMILSA